MGSSQITESSDISNLSYQPLTSFEELINYGSGEKVAKKCIPLSTSFCGSCPPSGKKPQGKRPLSLVCHDLKGGYGDDKFVNGTTNPENYTYRHWLFTDIFVYFSHKFVTVPPLGWINAGHSHGVKVLGTIITEWDDGLELCNKMLESSEILDVCVEKLCEVCKDFGFDGYLLNIENKLENEDQVKKMVEFTRKLTTGVKRLSSNNLVIWYDSVTKEGKLEWQDELNEKNKIFFDVCDGIYLNYNWTDDKLKNSVNIAGSRCYDVFAGIDCWGRGCWGGGGLNTCLAVDKISSHELSFAFFAPGWSYESHSWSEFPCFDDELWTKCMRNLYSRCMTSCHFLSGQLESCDNAKSCNNNDKKKFQVFFRTDFSRGYGSKQFSFGKIVSESSWFDLSKQSFQPVVFSSQKCLDYDCAEQQNKLAKWYASNKNAKKEEKPSNVLLRGEPKVVYDTNTGFSGGGSLKLLNSKKRPDFEDPLTSSPIWIPMNIPITDSRLTLAAIAIWKSSSIHHQLKIYLELGKEGCLNRKILLGSLDSLATSIRGKFYISLRLAQFMDVSSITSGSSSGASSPSESNDLQFYFQKNNYDEKELNGWRVSCFLFDIDQVYDEYSSIKSLRVGADGDISLGFLSLGQITHYHE